ncbi:MAG TPA: O-antigen ligase family protein [Candidatus Saccharimonadales bacterium]|nr:O-antigen ligase family protein [Candidatus Saccharimonadales bacterium]
MEKLKRLPLTGFFILLAYMPFHVFLSQWLSTFTGGLAGWKVAKDVFTMMVVLVSVGLVIQKKLYKKSPFIALIVLSLVYTLLHVLTYYHNHGTSLRVAELATVYNSRLLWYLLIGFSAALLFPKELVPGRLDKIVLFISTAVVCLGLAQYALPKNVMTHFGYSIARGARPAFFIDSKPDLPRIMSTVRDPNSLGAFLIVPILILLIYFFDDRNQEQRMLIGGLLGLHLLVLFLTFSRGAWLGLVLGSGLLATVKFKRQLIPWLAKQWPLVVGAVLLLGSLTLMFRHQYAVQNILVHSDKTTKQTDSNGLHLEFAENGARGIEHKPLGHGPGTAGIVSIQNSGGGLLTENYFIQIGYEVGLIGLALFLIGLAFVEKELTMSNASNLGVVLWISFWCYLLIAMVSHLWTNEAVAAQWWLLSGAVIGLKYAPKSKVKVS